MNLRPFLMFFRISDDEPGRQRRMQADFEALHYPEQVRLQLTGGPYVPGTYSLGLPNAPAGDVSELNLRPWRLDAGGQLRGQLTVLGAEQLRRWLAGRSRELHLTPLLV